MKGYAILLAIPIVLLPSIACAQCCTSRDSCAVGINMTEGVQSVGASQYAVPMQSVMVIPHRRLHYGSVAVATHRISRAPLRVAGRVARAPLRLFGRICHRRAAFRTGGK
jgi:hypothetical protein